MTGLIFSNPGAPDPGTHALVIGVGRYPHCTKGKMPPSSDPIASELGSLSSSPLSATAFAKFLLDEYSARHISRPVKSVRLLLSPLNGQDLDLPAGWSPAAATLANIRQAFDEWTNALSSNTENLALFYFCGHGLERVNQYLLAEDYASNQNRPMETAFDITRTHLASRARLQAKNQLWLVDACRESPPQLLQYISSPSPLMGGAVPAPFSVRAPILRSTGKGLLAYAPPNKISRFTGALLRALRGPAAQPAQGGWAIHTDDLKKAINAILDAEGHPQRCEDDHTDGGFSLMRLPSKPHIPVQFDTLGTIALPPEQLKVFVEDSDGQQHRALWRRERWRTDAPAGDATIRFFNINDDPAADPPLFETQLFVWPPTSELSR